MMERRALWIGIGLLVLLGGTLRAGEIGDPASPLTVAKWIKGDAVDLEKGKGKNVYVIEFWATWCPPCRTSIPHLSELAKKYRDKGVVIVGVTNETETEKVSKFVENLGDTMDYVVAQDDGRKTSDLYMKAFGQGGIPHAFVVDKEGRIVWHGHPMADLDEVLAAVVEGKFSMEQAKKQAMTAVLRQQHAIALRKYFQQLVQLQGAGDQLLEDLRGDPGLLNEFAWGILTNENVRGRDLDLALRAAKAAYDACDGKNAAILDTYARALWDTDERKQAIEYQKKAVELAEDGPMKEQLQQTLQEYEKAVRTIRL